MPEGEEGRRVPLQDSRAQDQGEGGRRRLEGIRRSQSRSRYQGSLLWLVLSLLLHFLRVPHVGSQSQQNRSRLLALVWQQAV